VAEPKRWIIIKMLQHAIERTEAEIAELVAGGLFVRDATPQDKTAHGEPVPAAAPAPPTPPPGSPPPGAKPDPKE
jgi:hypothetical protein